MASKFRKGTSLIKETADAKGGARRFTPNIYWGADGDVKTIVFTTAADDIPKVKLHQMVRVPDDKFERGFRYETFLCRKDPSMVGESGGKCELCDRIGHDATERFVALAVELEAVKQGKVISGLKVKHNLVKRDDGTEVEYPRWGLVVQGAKNFFSTLAAWDERLKEHGTDEGIVAKAWEIQREGNSIATKYYFFPVETNLPDLTEVQEQMPELEDLLEGMASDEKYAEVAALEEGSQPGWGENKSTPAAAPAASRAAEFERIKAELGGGSGAESY